MLFHHSIRRGSVLLLVLFALVTSLLAPVKFGTVAPALAAPEDYTIDASGVVTAYTGSDTDLVIPDGSTAIADGVFADTGLMVWNSMGEVRVDQVDGSTVYSFDVVNYKQGDLPRSGFNTVMPVIGLGLLVLLGAAGAFAATRRKDRE